MQVRIPYIRLGTALFASAALFAAPASASSGESSAAKVTTAAVSKPAAAGDSEKKICVTETKLGSRVSRKVCRTAAEWELENQARAQKGFDPHQRF